jgi:hypothetical protein
MTRIGISVALACMLLLALSGVAAAHGPSPYGWPAYSPYGSAYSGYTNGYGYGYATGNQYGYRVGYGEGYYGQYGCRSYCYPIYTYRPVCPGEPFLRFGGGYTNGGYQGPYQRYGGGYIIDGGHSWGMGGW